MNLQKRPCYRFSHVERLSRQHYDLGLLDSKGRKIGAIACVYLNEVFFSEESQYSAYVNNPEAQKHPVGSRHIFATVQTARNGGSFGASQSSVYMGPDGEKETERKLGKYIEKRLRAIEKRYLKEIEHKKTYGMTRGQRR